MENKNGKELCTVCKNELKEDFNFCPYCGKPQTDLAKDLILTQKDNYQLEILVKLLDKVDDEKTLKEIKLLVKKLSK